MRNPERLARAKRLQTLQEQMRRAAEWDLAETQRQKLAVGESEAALLRALGEDLASGLFLEAAARRLKALAGEMAALDAAAARQHEAVREQALAQKRSERRVAHLDAECRREAERRDLQARLEDMIARRTAIPGDDAGGTAEGGTALGGASLP
ncbi:hypothetical protein [Methylobacterium sp. ID0610]|uniref:hypothetical protein n=1 Tax=Methylobacterium carpenticola TaxID=3344827 RepID=UPI00368E4275